MEKTIVKGKAFHRIKLILLLTGILCIGIFLILYWQNVGNCRFYFFGGYAIVHVSIFDLIIFAHRGAFLASLFLDFGLLCCIAASFLFVAYAKVEITVTDKRVYGIAGWGKRVDLPFDSISAISTTNLKGISVATSSGAVSFKMIKNNKDIHKAISNLLIERQEKHSVSPTITQEVPRSDADELKKYKDLFDTGIITQEEFNAKKKQILGL